MFRFVVILLLFFASLQSCNQSEQLILVKDGKSDFYIRLPSNQAIEIKSAERLQEYLRRISSVKMPVSETGKAGIPAFILSDGSAVSSDLKNKLMESSPESFQIDIATGGIFISSGTSQGIYYGVNTFLEEYLGVMVFNSNEEFIPDRRNIALDFTSRFYSPAFAFRRPHFEGSTRDFTKFADWHKVSDFEDWGMFVHTFKTLLPPEEYFNEHPDYYALINGKRVRDSQPCLSNPNVINELIENLRKRIEAEPEKTYWSVSQNDYFNYCECETCTARYNKYGSISGLYIEMANAIAREFPDKQISTLAYQFTRSAPENIVPDKNVNIMFCSIECNRSMPLSEDPRSRDFIKDLEDWAALSNNIFMWDYVVQFKNYLCPFPNFHVLQPNIQLFKDHGVNMMFQQGSGRSWSDLSDLKNYLIAKLLWDPGLDADSIVDRFISHYYGPASPSIAEYYELSHKAIQSNQNDTFLNIYGYPIDYINSFLSEDLLIRYKELMDKAEASVSDQPEYLERVLRQRSVVDFAYLDIALATESGGVSIFQKNSNGSVMMDNELLDLLDKMVKNTNLTGNSTINERSLTTQEYREYFVRNADLMTSHNLLQEESISSKNPFSPKYNVGGLVALTDRKLGGPSFQQNWLGFEGEHIELEIDLGKVESISSIKMNFLRDNLSWVFLPRLITAEVSLDGQNFNTLVTYKADTIENEILERPVPYDFNFEKVKARFLRITARSVLKCPDWHRGAGGDAWLFVDELIIN